MEVMTPCTPVYNCLYLSAKISIIFPLLVQIFGADNLLSRLHNISVVHRVDLTGTCSSLVLGNENKLNQNVRPYTVVHPARPDFFSLLFFAFFALL